MFDLLLIKMRCCLILFILLSCFCGITYSKEVNTDLLLRCIAQVESNGVSSKIGSHNERSKYQFMSSTWTMYSRIPFSLIGQLKYQSSVDKVARQHLEYIKTRLTQRKMTISIYNIALLWNGGVNRVSYGRTTKDYAKRVENLYNSY